MTCSQFRVTGRQILVLVVFLATLLHSLEAGNPSLSNGLGEHIDWIEWKDAQTKAKEENKPLMVRLLSQSNKE